MGEIGGETEAGRIATERMLDPILPSREEVEEHEKTHLPYRNWCRRCVRGKGTEVSCRRQDEPDVPEFHMDYALVGDERGTTLWTLLVVRERMTRMVLATMVPDKATGEFATKRVNAFMKETGCEHGAITVKSDNENAIKSLVTDVGRVRAAGGAQKMNVEHSPKYSHKSNGVVERAIQAVEGQARVMRSALEEGTKAAVPADHDIFTWLFEYAAYLLNRGEVGHDGKTAQERNKGKRGRIPGMEFAEAVLWRRRPIGGALGKLTCLWEDGVYLGVKANSGEYIVADGKGIWTTRTVSRKPFEQRWGRENLDMVKGVPWKWSVEGEDQDRPQRLMDVPPAVATEEGERMEEQCWKKSAPRSFNISSKDLERHGYSRDCPGCKALLRKTARQGHSATCRERMEKAMKDEGKVKTARERQDRFVEKALEQEEAKRRKREDDNNNQENQSGSPTADLETTAEAEMAMPDATRGKRQQDEVEGGDGPTATATQE